MLCYLCTCNLNMYSNMEVKTIKCKPALCQMCLHYGSEWFLIRSCQALGLYLWFYDSLTAFTYFAVALPKKTMYTSLQSFTVGLAKPFKPPQFVLAVSVYYRELSMCKMYTHLLLSPTTHPSTPCNAANSPTHLSELI